MKYADFENKPLPEHTKLDYYECLAKIVLESVFPDIFVDLKIKDKPDLQNEKRKIGIEVTRAVNPIQEQNEKLYNKIAYGQVRNKDRAINVINSSYSPHSIMINGEKIREPDRYNEQILVGIPEPDSFNRINKAFKDKISKLNNGGYIPSLINYLFVYSNILSDQEMINKAIIDMNVIQNDYKEKFYKVFVCVPSDLYVLDLMNKIGEIKDIQAYQFDWSQQARKMVIQYELEHYNR